MADGFLNTIANPNVTGPDIAGQFNKNYLAQTSADLQKAEAADIRDKMITRNRIMAMNEKARLERSAVTPMGMNAIMGAFADFIGKDKPPQPSPQQAAQQQQQGQQKQEAVAYQNREKLLASILSVADKTQDPEERKKIMGRLENPQIQDAARKNGYLPESYGEDITVEKGELGIETNIRTARILKDVKDGEIPNLPAGRYELSQIKRGDGPWKKQPPKKVEVIPNATLDKPKELEYLARSTNPDKVQMQEARNQLTATESLDMTGNKKDFEAATFGMKEKRGTKEYADAFKQYLKDVQENRFMAMAESRGGGYFDLTRGKVVPASWKDVKYNPDKFISPTDPNVKALIEHQKYSTGMSRFTNRLDTLGDTIKNTIKQYELNTGSKVQNYTIQDLIGKQILGKGEIVGLQNLVNGFGAELGKVESGSIGISGATVEALKRFDIPANLPVKDMMKVLEIAQQAGKSVTDAMDKTRRKIYSDIYYGTPYSPPDNIGVEKSDEPQKQSQETKTLNGKSYHKVGGKWYAD